MIWLKLINVFGLLLDIVGAILMFANTPMHSRDPLGSHRGPTADLAAGAEYLFRGKAKEKTERKWIKIGVAFLIFGFLFQLISVVLN